MARFLGQSLNSGGPAIVVATQEHRDGFAEELQLRGIDVAEAISQGRYIALDAAETLSQFMVEGFPDRERFNHTIANVIAKLKVVGAETPLPAIFGEMVALLWADGKRSAAIRLEQLWNELAHTLAFSLFCAYPMSSFESENDRSMFFAVCGEHSHVTPVESYPAAGSEDQRRRSMAALQQKTRALENEIRLSQQRVLYLQSTTQTGTWEMDLQDDTFTFSSHAARMLRLAAPHIPLRQLLKLMYFSGDRDAFLAALKKARTGRKEFVVEFRVKLGEDTRVLSIRGKTVYNAGHPLVLGVLTDVTPLEEAPTSLEESA